MKAINLIQVAFVAMLCLIFACGDDNEPEGIVGSWRSTAFSLTNCDDGSMDLLDFSCGGCYSSVFNDDNSFSSTIFVPATIDSTIVGTYTLDGSNLITCDENGENCENLSYSLEDGSLILITNDSGCLLEVNFERS